MPTLPSDKCACSGANLDRFLQPVILSIVAKEPSTGYAVVKKVSEYITFAENGADPTGVYRYLKLMLRKGLIEQCQLSDSDSDTLTYQITDKGSVCLSSWQNTLSDYASTIKLLVGQLA